VRATGGYLRRVTALSRDVKLFLAASGAIGFAILNGIFPVLFNLYLLRLGHGPEFVGTVNAVGLLAYAVFAFPAGYVSRWLGLRRTMVMGVILSAVFFGLQPMVEFLPQAWREAWLLTNRVLGTVGLALYFVNASPYLANATLPGERSHAYSARMLVDATFGILGSLVGGALPELWAAVLGSELAEPAPYRYSLWLGALLSVLGAAALAAMRGVDLERNNQADGGRGPAGSMPLAVLALMGLVVLLRASGVGTSRTFFNVYLDHGLGVPTAQIGTLFAVVQVFAIPAALTMPSLTGRWGTFRVVVWTSVGVAASMLPLALIPHWATATLGRVGVYALSSISDPTMGIYQMEIVPRRWRAAMAGVSSTALGLSWTALALGGGYLITWLGYRELFLLAGALTLLGTLVFGLSFRTRMAMEGEEL
jgi:MFS family permease